MRLIDTSATLKPIAELSPVPNRLPPSYEAICGICREHRVSITAADQPAAEIFLRLHGWRYLDGIGWVCWECLDDGEERKIA